jgi:hypothetical protein
MSIGEIIEEHPDTDWQQSNSVGAIFAALAKAQAVIKNAVKSADNPFFKSKYADLAAVRDVCNGPLTENGICVVQAPLSRGRRAGVRTVLGHSSGEWLACVAFATPKNEGPQEYGSVISYLRRYSLAGFAGVATEDDDGNNATHGNDNGKPQAAGGAQRANKVQATPASQMANAEQVKLIHVLKEKIGGWVGKADHDKHPYRAALMAYKDANGKPVTTSMHLTFEQAKNLLTRMQGMIDRQAETLAKMDASDNLRVVVGEREPGSDDDDGEAADAGLLEDVRQAAVDRWGKKVKDLAPQWLQKEFGVDSSAALTKNQASRALQLLLAGETLS